jgi:hypothetical protein
MLSSLNLNIEFNQLLTVIKQCDVNQKLAIVKAIEKDTFKIRFKELIDELKVNDITIDEINEEVEIVRKERYNSKKK